MRNETLRGIRCQETTLVDRIAEGICELFHWVDRNYELLIKILKR